MAKIGLEGFVEGVVECIAALMVPRLPSVSDAYFYCPITPKDRVAVMKVLSAVQVASGFHSHSRHCDNKLNTEDSS